MADDSGYSRPATLDDLRKVIRSLNEQAAPYLLIGGYALFAHGYHRATEDIDLLVPSDREAAKFLIAALLVLPVQASAGRDPVWFEEGDKIRLADEVVIDPVFNTCGETYASLQPFVELIDWEGIPVRTLSLAGLLRTKQSAREKDVIDRMVLERILADMEKSGG